MDLHPLVAHGPVLTEIGTATVSCTSRPFESVNLQIRASCPSCSYSVSNGGYSKGTTDMPSFSVSYDGRHNRSVRVDVYSWG